MDMLSLVFLKTCASNTLTGELISAGYHVMEAASIPEVVWLCTQFHGQVVLVDPQFQDPELAGLEEKYVTLKLEADTTVQQLLWEIALRMPTKAAAC
jgi:hypothetical protein